MDDIVVRLKKWPFSPGAVPASDIMDEAADAIERLRMEREVDGKQMSAMISDWQKMQDRCVNPVRVSTGRTGNQWFTIPEPPTNHDAAPAAKAASRPLGNPVASAVTGTGNTPEPVAWAVLAKDVGATAAICSTFMDAERLAARSSDWRKEIVPLYRQPRPTLTDAEREAIESAAADADQACRSYPAADARLLNSRLRRAATLRGILTRCDTGFLREVGDD